MFCFATIIIKDIKKTKKIQKQKNEKHTLLLNVALCVLILKTDSLLSITANLFDVEIIDQINENAKNPR